MSQASTVVADKYELFEVAGDFVFVGLRDGTVLALNKATGKLEWSFDVGFGVYSSPVILDGVLYIGSGN